MKNLDNGVGETKAQRALRDRGEKKKHRVVAKKVSIGGKGVRS